MIKAPPAFQLYAQDFLVGTAMMTAAGVGAYIRLLCYQWTHGGIPNDQELAARLAGCDGITLASVWYKFGICENGQVRNAKLEEVRTKQREYRQKQANNANKRWKKGKKDGLEVPPHMPEGMPKACSSSSPSINTPIVPKGDEEGGRAPGIPTSPNAKRLGGIFNRRESTAWAAKEIRAFKALGKIEEEDLSIVERYYEAEKKNPNRITRRDLYTLLNNFPGEVDRAREYLRRHPALRTPASGPPADAEPIGFRDWFAKDYPDRKDDPYSQITEAIKENFRHHQRKQNSQ